MNRIRISCWLAINQDNKYQEGTEMNARPISVLVIFSIGSMLGLSPSANADCASAPNPPPKCVDISFPEKGKPASGPPEVLHVMKQDGEFGFALGEGATPNVYVIFKCQNYDPDPKKFDCRSPAKIASGANTFSTWTIKLTPGQLRRVGIRSDLEACDACTDMATGSAAQETCIQSFCRYPYMVVDATVPTPGNPSEYPPLDPDIIIDPR